MLHPFFAASRPLVFAHRGGAALAPENTLAAFDNGVALGSDGLELDVHLSRDGVAVVHHDPTLNRTTALSGRVRDHGSEDLRRAGVPLLAEVLRRYRDVRVIIDLKRNHPDLAREVVEVVRRADAVSRVCVASSFGLRVLRTVRYLEPSLATSASRAEVRWALYRSRCRWPVRHVPYSGYQVPERAGVTRVVSPRFVADAHGAQLAVQVWTVDTEKDARRLLGWGVDGLITDRPDVLVPIARDTGPIAPADS